MKLSVIIFISIGTIFYSAQLRAAKNQINTAAEELILAEKLNQELNFNQQRRKGFKEHTSDQKIFDREREKGLSLFLEEQEKFDIQREKGIAEHKKSLRKSLDESSPEYFEDLKEKKNREDWIEEARHVHVRTRDQILSRYNGDSSQSEMEELGLNQLRPKYDQRKRFKNKWIKSSTNKASTGGSSFGDSAPSPGGSMDFPAPVDYAPQPIMDNFDEIPPPPPPIPYEQGQGYDSGYGDAPIPPPPPPEGGWDF